MPTLLQSIGGVSGAGVTSFALAFSSNVTAGSLLVCVAAQSGPVTTTISVSDGVNGSYHSDVTNGAAGNICLGIFSFANSASGATTVTATFSSAATIRMVLQEWSGIATSNPTDQTVNAAGGSSTSLSSGATSTTTQASELVIGAGCLGNGQTFTAGSGFTLDGNSDNAQPTRLQTESQIVSVTGAQTATFTIDATQFWQCQCVTYKATTTAILSVPLLLQQPGPIGGPFNLGQFAPFQYARVTPAVAPINPVVGSLGFPIGVAGPGIGPSPRATFQQGLIPQGPPSSTGAGPLSTYRRRIHRWNG